MEDDVPRHSPTSDPQHAPGIESGFDLERRFGGIARLYGHTSLERFCAAHVCVVGVGGVGSWAAEALARSAVGSITLIDLDHVAESNVNRQVHALDKTIGKAKVAAMAERIRGINDTCQVFEIEDFVVEDNVQKLLGADYDFIIDASDSVRSKAAIAVWCRRNKKRLITVGGAGGQTDPTCIQVVDLSRTVHDPLLSKVRSVLRRRYGFPREGGRRFGIPAVFSTEHLVYPTEAGGTCREKLGRAVASGLSCAGFGSTMCVTAAFGLVAASVVLKRLAAQVADGRGLCAGLCADP